MSRYFPGFSKELNACRVEIYMYCNCYCSLDWFYPYKKEQRAIRNKRRKYLNSSPFYFLLFLPPHPQKKENKNKKRKNHLTATLPPPPLNPFARSTHRPKSTLSAFSGICSPLAMHKTRMPRAYASDGSSLGVMRKYCDPLPPSTPPPPPTLAPASSPLRAAVLAASSPVTVTESKLVEAWLTAGESEPAQAIPTKRPCTRRSLRGSMPWLISSTTRKGERVRDCRAMR